MAEKRGITVDPPDVAADEGFGLPPEESTPPKPVERDDPPDPVIHRELYLKKEEDAKKRKPKKVKLKPEHDPDYWAAKYTEKYPEPEVAAKLGYGRAMLERSKDLPLKEVLAELDRLIESRVKVGFLRDAVAKAMRYPKEAKEHLTAAGRLLAQHAKMMRGGNAFPAMEIESGSVGLEHAHLHAKAFFERLSSPRLRLQPVRWTETVGADGDRASYSPLKREVLLSASRANQGRAINTAVHEYAHAVEVDCGIGQASASFIRRRTSGEKLVEMSDLLPEHGYRKGEYTYPDEFWHPYMGKFYDGWYAGYLYTTEVFSTITGHIAVGDLGSILDKDPDSAFFVLGALAGY